jgi:hypothetical protein
MTRPRIGDRLRINFYFDAQIFEAMQKIAALQNTTYSELIRVACREYVIREAPGVMRGASAISRVCSQEPKP